MLFARYSQTKRENTILQKPIAGERTNFEESTALKTDRLCTGTTRSVTAPAMHLRGPYSGYNTSVTMAITTNTIAASSSASDHNPEYPVSHHGAFRPINDSNVSIDQSTLVKRHHRHKNVVENVVYPQDNLTHQETYFNQSFKQGGFNEEDEVNYYSEIV